jgi:hypothetical protein
LGSLGMTMFIGYSLVNERYATKIAKIFSKCYKLL